MEEEKETEQGAVPEDNQRREWMTRLGTIIRSAEQSDKSQIKNLQMLLKKTPLGAREYEVDKERERLENASRSLYSALIHTLNEQGAATS
jgi:hypothetical protein